MSNEIDASLGGDSIDQCHQITILGLDSGSRENLPSPQSEIASTDMPWRWRQTALAHTSATRWEGQGFALSLAQATNDDVTREHHWQHAEHHLRLVNGSAS